MVPMTLMIQVWKHGGKKGLISAGVKQMLRVRKRRISLRITIVHMYIVIFS